MSLLFYLLLWSSFHDIHLSMTQINYNETANSLEIMTSIFLDDLEYTFEDQAYGKQHLCTKLEKDSAEIVLVEYLSEHINFTVNGEEKYWQFIGKEISPDLASVYCYLELVDVSKPKTIQISLTTLFEKYDDQQSIIHFKGPGNKQEYIILDHKTPRKELNLAL